MTLAKQIGTCVIAIVVVLFPLRQTSAPGWGAYLVALALLVTAFFGLTRVLTFFETRPRHGLMYRLMGVLVAVVPAVSLVYLLFLHAVVVMRLFQ